MMPSKIRVFYSNPVLWIIAIAVIAFWQVAFLVSGLHWDMLDVHLPSLYFISQVLHTNELHYWDPYQQLGYPIHADMQVTWYPLTLFVARFIGFNLVTLQYFFLLHILIAGIGMYRLCGFFYSNKPIAFAGAISYMLCGFFVSDAQHLHILTSAAWLPFVLYYFLKVSEGQRFIDALKLSVVAGFIVAGGYLFLTVILFYFVAVVVAIIVIRQIKKDKQKTFRILELYFIAAVLVLLMCLPMIISLMQVMPVLERGTPLSTDVAISFPYTLRALWLSQVPFAMADNSDFFGTDITMAGIYSGIALFVFFVYGLFKKSGFWQYVFIAFGVFCLAASLARELPLMKWLISWVPMLSYFRFPSLLRLFFILGSVIFSLGALKFFLNDFEREKKKLLLSAIFLIAIAAAILSYAIVKVDFQHLTFAKPHDSIAGLLHGLSLYERILFGGAIQLLMLIIFVLILLRSKSQFSFLKFVVGLFIVDLIISVQTNINFTVADPAVKPIETEAKLDSIIPAGFPIPKRTSMLNAQNEGTGILGIWRNVNDFTKQPATDGFSSFWLNDYILLDNDTLLKKKVLDNPPVYLSAEVFPMKELADHKSRDLIRRKNIYLPDQDYEKIKNTKMLHAPSDTAAFLQFGPNTFRIKVKSSDAQVLTLMQSNYAGWHVKVNGKPSQWMKSNFLFMSVLIPSGEYEVEFYYENNFVKYGFIIALITLLSVMTALILFRVRRSVYK